MSESKKTEGSTEIANWVKIDLFLRFNYAALVATMTKIKLA
jgi:hypothetical protein